MSIAKRRPRDLDGDYSLRGSYRLCVSTGAVTTIAAATATAGHLLSFRWSNTTSSRAYLRYIAAKFTLTTAYTTAQETGVDLILARGYTASHTGATAVDTGSTVANTGKLMTDFGTSLMGVAGLVRVAGAGALTAGTHTLDANPVGVLSGWSGAIGDKVPDKAAGINGGWGALFDARDPLVAPIRLKQDEGFVIRNTILMGAVGVGRWDFLVEWDEGTPEP
jgi:hypothetical protein